MNDLLRELTVVGGQFHFQDIVVRVGTAAFLGMVIYISYWYTHAGTAYSRKFNVSLVTLAILSGTVMTVIGNNIALSLGMVGALSIVRFRTAIKDSRDTTYIFWAIIAGLCCGVGDYLVAAVGSAVVFIVMLILGRVRNDNRIILIVKGARSNEKSAESIVFNHFNRKALLKVKNTSSDSVEYIYELTRSAYKIDYKKQKNITQLLYELDGIDYVNIVTQNDEISG